MLNLKSFGKILFNILKVILYSFLILFSFTCIIALHQIYTEKDDFNKRMALIFLILFSVFLSFVIYKLLKKIFTFCSRKISISKKHKALPTFNKKIKEKEIKIETQIKDKLKEKFTEKRYNIFLNQEVEKFLRGIYQVLSTLCLLAFYIIFISILVVLIYKILVFTLYFFGVIVTLFIGFIVSFPYILFLFFL